MNRLSTFPYRRPLIVLMLAMALVVVLFGTSLSVASAVDGPQGVVKTGALNMRSGPGPGYAVVATLPYATHVTMVGRTSDSGWIKVVTSDGTEGWVSSLYLLSGVPFSTLPVLAQAEPWGIIIAGTANMRTGPGTQFTIMATLKGGSFVNLVGRDSTGNWIYIRALGSLGWVAGSVVSSKIPFGTLPTTDAAGATIAPLPPTSPTQPPTGGTTGGTGGGTSGGTGGTTGGTGGGSGTGMIKGKVFPLPAGSTVPEMHIYALNLATMHGSSVHFLDACARDFFCPNGYPGSWDYTIGNLAAGDYVVFAYATVENGSKYFGGFYGGWTKNPTCGGTGTAEDHSLIIIHLGAGQTATGANICDLWYPWEGYVPPEPGSQ